MLGDTRQHFGTRLGDHLKQQVTNRKHKYTKPMALNRQRKGHLFAERAERRRQGVTSFNVSWDVGVG